MYEILKNFNYPKNTNRNNIKIGDEIYRGFCLGLIYSWRTKTKQNHRRLKMKKYIYLFDETKKYFLNNSPEPDFKYTTIQYNSNHKCKKHKDKNNIGDSYIIGLGEYSGGRLIIYDENDNPKYIDINNKFYKFNGSQYYHETEDFIGDRHTLVFFNII
tara:strand:- start:40 stop:513 length:474 start_codon:yes stop_codon:yes gene_type:complete